jgi:hypothetical protein
MNKECIRARKPSKQMRNKFAAAARLVALLPILLLAGCLGRVALRHNYQDYSEVYADAVNRQLLLNIARLSRDEPPYFIQLGTINSQFTFNGSLAFAPNDADVGPHSGGDLTKVGQNTLTLGGTATASAVESPTFQFVPLNGDTFAQAITAPIDKKVFYTLYDQDYPADELMRLLVQSVQIEDTSHSGHMTVYVNDPNDQTYASFLLFCHNLRTAQVEASLLVRNKPSADSTTFADVKLADAVTAISSGLTVKNGATPTSFIVSPADTIGFISNPTSKSTRRPYTQGGTGNAPNVGQDPRETFLKNFADTNVSFNLRTFITVLHSAAKEQIEFEQLTGSGKEPSGMKFGSKKEYGLNYAILSLDTKSSDKTNEIIFPILCHSGLKAKDSQSLATLIKLSYHGEAYRIGDVVENNLPIDLGKVLRTDCIDSSHSNRRVFTLITYLFTQIAIDPKKLPVQQLIQVH